MKIILATLVIFTTIVIELFGQDPYSDTTLKSIYEVLEYETNINDLTGEKWDITEPWLIRQIIENLDNNGKLVKIPGSDPSKIKKDYELIAEAILKNQVRIRCAQRYYDKNLSSLSLIIDTVVALRTIDYKWKDGWLWIIRIDDWVEIKESIGEISYDNILAKNYQYIDLTRRDSSPLKEPKLVLSIYKSELFYYSFNWDKSKVFMSVYFNLGNDNINLPSWYSGYISVAFLRARLNPSKLPNRLNYEKLGVTIGWDAPQNFSIPRDLVPSFINDMFKDRRLIATSDNLFFGISYSPLELNDAQKNKFIYLAAEASLPLGNKKKTSLALGNVSEFQSIRESWSIGGTYGNIWKWLDLGASVSGFTLNNYSALPTTNDLEVLDSKHHLLFSFEPAISREDPPFYYTLSPQINFDITNGQKFFVFKSVLFFGTNVGLDFRYFISLNGDNTAPWHYKDYIVISPIFIIN